MTTPSAADQATSPAPEIPKGIKIASTLCFVVAIATFLMGLAVGIPALSAETPSVVPLLGTSLVALAVCGAAILIRRQRRLGVLVLALAWATPVVAALLQHQPVTGGPLLVIIALLLAGANWKDLR